MITPLNRTMTLLTGLALVILPGITSAQAARAGQIPVIITTDRGEITAILDSAKAPSTVINFLRYVDAGHYTGGAFHRTVTSENQPNDSVRIAVIQGAIAPERRGRSFSPIPLEPTGTTGLRHRDGTLSMARSTPHSATSAFFITIGDQPALDQGGHRNLDLQGFAAFGVVTTGMEIVRSIQQAPHTGQSLTPPITILGIRRASLPR